MATRRLTEEAHFVSAVVPINTTGAAQSGDWVNMKHYRRALIVIQQGAWAGGTSAVTVNQATANDGTGSKAVSFTEKYEGVALTDDILAEVAVSSNTFDLDTANEFHIIEIDPTHLDRDNGFDHIQVALASPGANADLVSALYILYDGDFVQDPTNHKTAL